MKTGNAPLGRQIGFAIVVGVAPSAISSWTSARWRSIEYVVAEGGHGSHVTRRTEMMCEPLRCGHTLSQGAAA
jgi:hypothetical protein